MIFLPESSIEKRIVDSLPICQRHYTQIARTDLTGLDDFPPEAYSTVRLFLPVNWRDDDLNAPRQFDIGTLATHLFIKVTGCLQVSTSILASKLNQVRK